MLSRLKIGPKLLLAPAIVLVLLVFLSCGAWYARVRQNASLEDIVGQRAVQMRAASELVAQFEPVPQMLKNVRYAAGADPLARCARGHGLQNRYGSQASHDPQPFDRSRRDFARTCSIGGRAGRQRDELWRRAGGRARRAAHAAGNFG